MAGEIYVMIHMRVKKSEAQLRAVEIFYDFWTVEAKIKTQKNVKHLC